MLVFGNTADDARTPGHTHRLFEAIPHEHGRLHGVHEATHYCTGPDGCRQLGEAIGVIGEFLEAALPA